MSDKTFYKILNKGEKNEKGEYISAYSTSTALYNGSRQGLRYELGLNIDPQPLRTHGSLGSGLYFTTIDGIEEYMFAYGTILAVLEVPEDEEIILCYGNSYRSHSVIVKEFLDLNNNSTWKYLLQNGFRPRLQNYMLAMNMIRYDIDCMIDIIDYRKYERRYLNKWMDIAIKNKNEKAQNVLEMAISCKK